MDKQGYLPLSLISSFPRVSQVTKDLNLIALAVMDSEKVELDHTKERIRSRFNPEIWPMELQSQFSNDEGTNNQSSEHERHPLTVRSPTEISPPPIKPASEKSSNEDVQEPPKEQPDSSRSTPDSKSQSPESEEKPKKEEASNTELPVFADEIKETADQVISFIYLPEAKGDFLLRRLWSCLKISYNLDLISQFRALMTNPRRKKRESISTL